MSYTIKVWVPMEDDSETVYDTLEEAEADLDQALLMQPENRYEIEEVPE